MSEKKNKLLLIFFAVIIAFIVISGLIRISNYFPFLFQLLFNKEIQLKQTDGTVNLLLLGIGGGNHDGPNLTDTIIFTSFNPSKDKINLITIPRDLWVPDLKDKINTAYATGESKREGGGKLLAKAVVSKILGEEIDYVVRIDFNGFVQAVDMLGGLDVNVENSFDDYEYPIEGKENDPCGHPEEELIELATASSQLEAFPCRYKHLHFDKGMQHMDGETSLEFVRSRHAKGNEGSDFARSKRQEKVINALKDKVFSLNLLLSPTKILDLMDVIKNSIDTNISQEELDDFFRLAEKMKQAKITSGVLDTGDEKRSEPRLLENPPVSEKYKLQWVLIPAAGDNNFSEIQNYVDCQLGQKTCQKTEIKKETAN